MTRTALLLAALVVCGAAAPAQKPPPPPSRLFQQAIDLMETKGDYPAALALFEQIAQGNDRALAARSLLYAGACYEKLGKQAFSTYQRLIRDFADQPAIVAAARARLAALTPAVPHGSNSMSAHQVSAGAGLDFIAVSPDGRYLSGVDWTTGDLAAIDLETKQKRILTKNGSSVYDEYAYGSVYSPDAKEIAYAWFNADRAVELRVIRTDGGLPRTLYRDAEVSFIDLLEWSADGRYVLCNLHRPGGKRWIALIATADGSAHVLKKFDGAGPLRASLSPDGRFLAYDVPQRDGSHDRDIFLLATRGNRDVPLIEHPANDFSPIWTADGRRLLFTSDRSGTFGLWSIAVADGSAQGSAELVRADMKASPMRISRSGSYFYSLQTMMKDVYVAQLDPVTGEVTTAPAPVSRRLVGGNSWPEWSPDGKFLAFVTNRTPGAGDVLVVSIVSIESGTQEELFPKMAWMSRLRWSPDGRALLANGRDERGRGGLYRIDAHTGEVSAIVATTGAGFPRQAAWSPEGRTIYYMGDGIVARDVVSGVERQIRPAAADFALSPDGRFMAVPHVDATTKAAVMDIVTVRDGTTRELLRMAAPGAFGGYCWTADGRYLLWSRERGGKRELWRTAVDSGASKSLGLSMVGLSELRAHPDGRRIAIGAGELRGEIWAMDHFLPAPEPLNAAREP